MSVLDEMQQNLPKLLREKEQALKEREQEIARLQSKLQEEHPNLGKPSDVLRINVGGTKRIDVLRRTLTCVEGSMLESKFSGRWDDSLEKDADGNFFVDQPDKLFVPMIDYLRAKQTETPLARIAMPPSFPDDQSRIDFERMVEYYGLTLAVYCIGIYRFEKNGENMKLVGEGEDRIESDDWATFCLKPYEACHSRRIRGYEVTLEKCSSAQIGWVMNALPTLLKEYSLSEGGRGVGYGKHSMAIDCVRSGIVDAGEFSALLSGTISLKEDTKIRLNDGGANVYVDGELVASANANRDNILSFEAPKWFRGMIPCISIKGSLKISKIELEF